MKNLVLHSEFCKDFIESISITDLLIQNISINIPVSGLVELDIRSFITKEQFSSIAAKLAEQSTNTDHLKMNPLDRG